MLMHDNRGWVAAVLIFLLWLENCCIANEQQPQHCADDDESASYDGAATCKMSHRFVPEWGLDREENSCLVSIEMIHEHIFPTEFKALREHKPLFQGAPAYRPQSILKLLNSRARGDKHNSLETGGIPIFYLGEAGAGKGAADVSGVGIDDWRMIAKLVMRRLPFVVRGLKSVESLVNHFSDPAMLKRSFGNTSSFANIYNGLMSGCSDRARRSGDCAGDKTRLLNVSYLVDSAAAAEAEAGTFSSSSSSSSS